MRRSLSILLVALSLAPAALAQSAGIGRPCSLETAVVGDKAQVRLSFPVTSDQLQVGTFVSRIFYKEYFPRQVVEHVVAESRNVERVWDGKSILQTFELDPVRYWTPEKPTVFYVRTAAEFADGTKDSHEESFLFRGPEPQTVSGVILPADGDIASWDADRWECTLSLLKAQGVNAVAPADTTGCPAPVQALCDRIGLLLRVKPGEDFRPYGQVLDGDFFPAGREIKGSVPFKLEASSPFRGTSLSLVRVQAVDRYNRLTPVPAVTFEVKGPARLEAAGKASAFIRHTGPGPVTVTVSSKNRGKVTITL